MLRGAIALAALLLLSATAAPQWSDAELKTLRSLRIGALGPPPPDPTNRVADDPAAAELGRLLFNDTRLSANGKVSCATCHDPAAGFTDAVPLGEGVATGNRRTMPVVPALYSPWQFWDGRADSLWAQALGPLENPVEHGSNRAAIAAIVAAHYAERYRLAFGELPASEGKVQVDRTFVNVGKAIAAFERTQRMPESRFDRYVEGLFRAGSSSETLTADERAGLRLFIGKGQCTRCHNGPLLTNHGFANTGVPERPDLPPDRGRAEGIRLAKADPFNCRGPFNDSADKACDELDFAIVDTPELVRAYKVPSLRGVARRPPYMHAGQLRTLEEVVDHYDRAPRAPAGHSELEPLGLTAGEKRSLVAFLRTLDPEAGPRPPRLAAARQRLNDNRQR